MIKTMKFKDLPVYARFIHLGMKRPSLFRKSDNSRARRFYYAGDVMTNIPGEYRRISPETKVLRIY